MRGQEDNQVGSGHRWKKDEFQRSDLRQERGFELLGEAFAWLAQDPKSKPSMARPPKHP